MKNLTKKIPSIAFSLLLIISAQPLTSIASANGVGVCGPENFAGGNGTEGNPYQVYDQNSLTELNDCGSTYRYYEQIADINLVGNWTPIELFRGNYNGNNYEINNINIDTSITSAGLFGTVLDSNITAMKLSGSVINGGQETGLLAGGISSTTVLSIDAKVNVQGVQDTGGLIGAAYSSVIAIIDVSPLNGNSLVSGTYRNLGGVIGFAQNTDVDVVQSTVHVLGTTAAYKIGGVIGSAEYVAGDVYDLSYLIFTGVLMALNTGSYQCGGIAGYSDFAIMDALVLNSEIVCEHLDIGGIVGSSTNNILGSRVEASVEARKIDGMDSEMQVGGIVGYWMPSEGDWRFTHNSFRGSVTGEYAIGGLIGVANVENVTPNSSYLIEKSHSYGQIEATDLAGGIIGDLVGKIDVSQEANPTFQIIQSYASVAFVNDNPFNDSIVFTDFPVNFDAVLWDKSAPNSKSLWTVGVDGFSHEMLTRPGLWKNFNYDFLNVWGMNKSIFDGLPVLQDLYLETTFDVQCEVKAFPAVKFKKNSSKLDASSKKAIRKIAQQLISGNCSEISITGYTSSVEKVKGKKPAKYQKQLSLARAVALSSYVSKVLDNANLTFSQTLAGKGAKNRINKDKSKKQQAANMRVVVATMS